MVILTKNTKDIIWLKCTKKGSANDNIFIHTFWNIGRDNWWHGNGWRNSSYTPFNNFFVGRSKDCTRCEFACIFAHGHCRINNTL